MKEQHAKLIAATIAYDKGDARRIQHFVKVHDFAATIARLEGLDKETTFILETAAILHDIGIHPSEAKYGNCNGKHQEELGPAEADRLLREVGGYTEAQIQRVCFLIAHHHTYTHVEGLDWQILLEADFLVNSFEDNLSPEGIRRFEAHVFRTSGGRQLLETMWNLPPLSAKEKPKRIAPEWITVLAPGEVFVFGSNLAGQHHGGAARIAHQKFGAEWGIGDGPTGQCYALPTMHGGVEEIKPYAEKFIAYARLHPELRFLLTRIGCGIAGFEDEEMAPLFSECLALPNVAFPREWLKCLMADAAVTL